MTKTRLTLTILLAFILLAGGALAIPGIPHALYGNAILNGAPAPDGTAVVAKINGVQVASTTTSGGKYGYPIGSFYVSDPNSDRSGKTISIFFNGVDAGKTVIFCTGCFNLCGTNTTSCPSFDMSATGATAGGSTGGGSGGGGMAIQTPTPSPTVQPTVTNQTANQTCQEKWICSDWSACSGGVQTRTCVDKNSCGTNNNEPFSSQPCSKEERQQTQTISSPITAFFLALTTTDWIAGISVGVMIALATIFLLMRKRGAGKSKAGEAKVDQVKSDQPSDSMSTQKDVFL